MLVTHLLHSDQVAAHQKCLRFRRHFTLYVFRLILQVSGVVVSAVRHPTEPPK